MKQLSTNSWSWLIAGGCPRSGTSLLNFLLNSHPAVRITNENSLARLIRRTEALFYREQLIRNLPGREMGPNEKWTGEDVRRATLSAEKCLLPLLRTIYEANFADQVDLAAVKYFGDKLPQYYDFEFGRVREVLSPLKIIHISRNPLDVVNSMLRRARNAQLGKDHWNGAATAEEGCIEWAKAWNFACSAGRQSEGSDLQICHLKYEDLLSGLDRGTEELCCFLDLPDRFDRSRVVRDASSPREMLDDNVRATVERMLPGIVRAWQQPLAKIEAAFPEIACTKDESESTTPKPASPTAVSDHNRRPAEERDDRVGLERGSRTSGGPFRAVGRLIGCWLAGIGVKNG